LENQTPYKDWPERVKISTALSHKSFLLKNHKVPLVLGYILIVIGIISIVDYFTRSAASDGMQELFSGLAYLLIGIANIWSAQSIKWISLNSNWEERFKQPSSGFHKFLYLLVSAILVGSLVCVIGGLRFFK